MIYNNFQKGGIFTYHEDLSKKKEELEKLINSIQSKIKKLPPGKIIVAKNGNDYKWYQSDGKNKTYIYKAERSFAEQLAWKKYLTLTLEDLKQKQHIITSYTRLNKKTPDKAEKLLMHPGYQELLEPILQLTTNESTDWMKGCYDKNPNYPEHLTLKSISGNLVRSKSELLIDTFLYNNKIPFRYECALVLNGITIYPDFTISHPLTKEIYYWEHLGMLDDPTYRQKALKKINTYMENDIYPMDKLILTCETKERALDTEIIQKVIETYFLY